MIPAYPVYLFDLDGTLLDSATDICGAVRQVLSATGEVRAQKQAVVADDSAWTTGKLVFRDAPLSRVAGELRRWYGIRLGFADSTLKRRTVTTSIEAGQPIDDVLRIVSLSIGMSFERQGDTATFHAGRGSK